MTVINPFDSLLSHYADGFSLRLYQRSQNRTRALSCDHRARGQLFLKYLADIPREGHQHGEFPGRAQRATAEENSLHSSALSRASRRPSRRWPRCRIVAVTRRGCLIQILRHLGLAARFVSGYPSVQLRPDIDPVEGPREIENDFTEFARLGRSLSARCGLDRFDVTSGMLTGEGGTFPSLPARIIARRRRSVAAPGLPTSNSASR